MRIALAQIDARLGDIEGVCERLESQAAVARDQGADLICIPSPLLTGIVPGALIESANFEHDLVSELSALAGRLAELGIMALVPAVVAFDRAPLFEVFLLKKGRVVPLRTLLAHRRSPSSDDAWAPPVFDVAGTRVAVSFDALRDIDSLPSGCDLMIFFQSNAFDASNEASCAVASVPDGYFAEEVARKGVWLACMSPVGAFDDVVFCGGSFVMDDSGRVISHAPCFEEALLVQEIRRGVMNPCVETHELPRFSREEWTWEALRLYVRDTVSARGFSSAALLLTGDLPSSLACALAVDALGPRNVTGVFVERGDVFTPAQERAERDRAEVVRELARNLSIRLVERSSQDASRLLDRDVPASGAAWLRERMEGLCLEDVSVQFGALPVSSITKTDAALAANALSGGFQGAIAPFGDVYLTALEFMARARNHAAAAIPVRLVGLREVGSCLDRIMARACMGFSHGAEVDERVAHVLGSLEPPEVDAFLEAHVDRGLSIDETPLFEAKPEAAAVLAMLVRTGEADRRGLPAAPVVSARSFMERAWPASLAWSDTGRGGEKAIGTDALVEAEFTRLAKRGIERGERMRGEIIGIIASSLGIPVEMLKGLGLDDDSSEAADDEAPVDLEGAPDGTAGGSQGGASASLPFPLPGFMAPPSSPGGVFFSDN